MSVQQLFKGIAVVIDDEVKDVNSTIVNIITEIKRDLSLIHI